MAQAEARIGPALAVENVSSIPFSGTGTERVVTPPAGKRVRSLTLSGLKWFDGTPLPNFGDLRDDRRLVVSLPDGKGGWNPPQFAVPALNARGMLPASLTGASYDAGVLRLPDVAADRLQLTVTDGDFPEEFDPHDFQLAGVAGQLVSGPKDLTLADPAGGVLWTFPGELPPGTQQATVDLRLAIETAFEAALASGAPLEATLTLRAATAPARAGFDVGAVHGALLRVQDGTAAYEVEGGALPLSLGGPLADEAPSSATSDVRVRYRGLRLHETLRDPVPAAAGDVAGVVVGAQPVLRSFPPEAFEHLPPGRIGIVGRAPQPCELSVSLRRGRRRRARAARWPTRRSRRSSPGPTSPSTGSSSPSSRRRSERRGSASARRAAASSGWRARARPYAWPCAIPIRAGGR